MLCYISRLLSFFFPFFLFLFFLNSPIFTFCLILRIDYIYKMSHLSMTLKYLFQLWRCRKYFICNLNGIKWPIFCKCCFLFFEVVKINDIFLQITIYLKVIPHLNVSFYDQCNNNKNMLLFEEKVVIWKIWKTTFKKRTMSARCWPLNTIQTTCEIFFAFL